MPPNAALIGPRKALARALADFIGGPNGPLGSGSTQPGLTIDTGHAAGPIHFAQVMDSWPDPEKKLVYPAASVVTSKGNYYASSLGPELLENDTAYTPPLIAAPSVSGQVLEKFGEYETTVQLDLWADTEVMRDAVQRAMEDALGGDPQGGFSGLRLSLASYYNRVAVYSISDDESEMQEDRAFRKERRVTLLLDASTEWVRLVSLPIFKPQTRLSVGFAPLTNSSTTPPTPEDT